MENAIPRINHQPLAETSRARKFADLLKRMLRARTSSIAALILLAIALAAILAPVISPFDPFEIHARDRLLGPTSKYFIGTDELGRDLLSVLLHAARISLMVAAASEVIAILLGVPLGLLAGYKGGFVDDVIMRLMDGLLAFPGILMGLTIVGLLGRTIENLLIAIGIMNLPYLVRIVRAAVVVEREKDYVLATRAVGASEFYIMRRTILSNILSPLIVQVSFGLAVAILIESSLSFLGLGVQPPSESLGTLLQRGYSYIGINPWLVTFPGLLVFATAWAFNLLGDALRDALDPRLREV